MCYVINASDLHPVCPSNIIFKYADDTYVIAPAANTALICLEIDNVVQWAAKNNLKLNTAKSRHMVIHLPGKQIGIAPVATGIPRVDLLTVLGVSFTNTLSFAPHVHNLTAKAAQSLYALKTLRAHGLKGEALFDVTVSTLVAQLLYACSAWWGFLGTEDKYALQSILSKASRYGYLPVCFKTLTQLVKDRDETLFSAVCSNSDHVLHSLLPAVKQTGYNLRKLSHGFTLACIQSCLLRKNFVLRMLFSDIY